MESAGSARGGAEYGAVEVDEDDEGGERDEQRNEQRQRRVLAVQHRRRPDRRQLALPNHTDLQLR